MRTAHPDPAARRKIIAAAQQLMLSKGYAATSLEEICQTAGLTKGSFFHYFNDKQELGRTVLDGFYRQMVAAAGSGPFLKEPDPLKRVYGYVDSVIAASRHPAFPDACLIGTFTQELSDTHPDFRDQCASYFREWASTFKNLLDAATPRRSPKSRLDTKGLAEHFIAVVEGSLILAKAQQDKTVVGKHLKHFKSYVKGQFEKEGL
jgi:TetR/AcrR family transcriptional regulator, transcriptional repressor for nem operon